MKDTLSSLPKSLKIYWNFWQVLVMIFQRGGVIVAVQYFGKCVLCSQWAIWKENISWMKLLLLGIHQSLLTVHFQPNLFIWVLGFGSLSLSTAILNKQFEWLTGAQVFFRSSLNFWGCATGRRGGRFQPLNRLILIESMDNVTGSKVVRT